MNKFIKIADITKPKYRVKITTYKNLMKNIQGNKTSSRDGLGRETGTKWVPVPGIDLAYRFLFNNAPSSLHEIY